MLLKTLRILNVMILTQLPLKEKFTNISFAVVQSIRKLDINTMEDL